MTDMILFHPLMRGMQTHGTEDDIIIHPVGLSDKLFLESSYSRFSFSYATLPLWDPSPVEVGAVGYLIKPQVHFVTLFKALIPGKATNLGIQSLPLFMDMDQCGLKRTDKIGGQLLRRV